MRFHALRRRVIRGALAVAASAALALAAAPAGHASAPATATGGDSAARTAPPLRALAASRGIYYGTAVTASKLSGTYAHVAGSQFDSVTPGNEMKWETVEPARGQYDWSGGDAVVAFARTHGMQVRGHNLVWHNQLPGWLTSGTWTPAQLHAILVGHVTTEVRHYKGEIAQWDVVNEPLNEDGTLRQSMWETTLGPSYIADAFRAAHAADPHAKLFINDYNIEGLGAKSDGMYNLVKSLKAQGVPIDGVGFQAHFVLGQVPSTMKANLQRFAALGLDVAVTELDVRMQLPATDAKLAQQASDYAQVTDDCLAVRRCLGVTVWGFTDSDSWIPGWFTGYGAATPYDENFRPKPAYYAIRAALRHH